jgi:DNA-directed RNA polymerase specialized sigma24 family protein
MIAARRTIDQLRKVNRRENPIKEPHYDPAAAQSQDQESEEQLQRLTAALA